MEKIEVREYEVFKYVWECPKCYTELNFWKIFKNL